MDESAEEKLDSILYIYFKVTGEDLEDAHVLLAEGIDAGVTVGQHRRPLSLDKRIIDKATLRRGVGHHSESEEEWYSMVVMLSRLYFTVKLQTVSYFSCILGEVAVSENTQQAKISDSINVRLFILLFVV